MLNWQITTLEVKGDDTRFVCYTLSRCTLTKCRGLKRIDKRAKSSLSADHNIYIVQVCHKYWTPNHACIGLLGWRSCFGLRDFVLLVMVLGNSSSNSYYTACDNITLGYSHPAPSGQTVRLPVWPWQVCVRPVRKGGGRATWIFIMTSPVYWLLCGGHTQVR